MSKLFSERSQNKSVNGLPDIGNEADRLEDAVPVIIAEVIAVNLVVEEKDALGEQIFTKAFSIGRKGSLVDSENHEPDMPEYKLLGFRLTAPFGHPDKAAFFL